MSHSDPRQLGTLMRRFRIAAGYSQEQLAERSGVSTRAVSDLERGQSTHPRPETLRMLADAMALGSEDRTALLLAARPDLEPASATFPPAARPRADLPIWTYPLIGRELEMAALAILLGEEGRGLITLTGPGGVGKTRLALEAARRAAPSFPDGVVFVDLSPIRDPALVVSAMSQSLGIQESGGETLDESLGIALQRRRLLLMLDNFEQVIGAASRIAALLNRAPELQILVTSREALRVRGEYEVVVQPLELPTQSESLSVEKTKNIPAVALFLANCQTANPGFALTDENAPAVVEICRRLDGLPLAIELAASRVRHFPPSVLLDHLERRLPVLTGGSRDLPLRQQTLRDTIAWSYDLLTPDEQALFRRLGVFVGGSSIPAIEAVIPAAGVLELDLLSGLASLVDQNLVRERPGHREMPRFSMLETIREFALDKLNLSNETDAVRDALADYEKVFIESWGSDHFINIRGFTVFDGVDEELENIRLASDHFASRGDAESCASVFVGMFDYYNNRGLHREAVALARKSLELALQDPRENNTLWGFFAQQVGGDGHDAGRRNRGGVARP